MKFVMNIRARMNPRESISEKHDSFIAALERLPDPFFFANFPPAPSIGTELIAVVQLARYLKPKPRIRGRLIYSLRFDAADKAMYDDHLTIEFDPQKVDFGRLATEIFPTYLRAFAAYQGEIGDIQLADKDFEEERKKNQRDCVYRIYPVSYMDRELCMRSFGFPPDEVIKRLKGHVLSVDKLNDGVAIVAKASPASIEESDQIQADVMRLLGR